MTQNIKKICNYCGKEFLISKESQQLALEKGGEISRQYCNECLLRWRKGEIDLKLHEQRKHGKIPNP